MANLLKSRSMNESDVDRMKRLAKSSVVLATWFRKWTNVFPTHEVTQKQILAYTEALDDLAPEQIDEGCREASRDAEQFPKPGHIRHALEGAKVSAIPAVQFMGPPLIEYSEVTQEEREQALEAQREYTEKLKRHLGIGDRRVERKERKRFVFNHPVKSFEEQKEELRRRGHLQ
jgi:hypothetical protein